MTLVQLRAVMPQNRFWSDDELAHDEPEERSREAHRALRDPASLTRVPDELMRCTPDELLGRVRAQDIRVRGSEWGRDAGNLLLLGDSGAGKTSMAAWVLRREASRMARESSSGLQEARCCRWVSAVGLSQARAEARMGDHVPLLEAAKRATVLVLDDLGQESESADLKEVVNHRYHGGRPTIVTSGLTLKAIEERYLMEFRRRLLEQRGRRALVGFGFRGGAR